MKSTAIFDRPRPTRAPQATTIPGTRAGGFTLIELLVVTLVLLLLVGSIGACLMGGIRVWDAARQFGEAEAQAMRGLNLMTRDLRNLFASRLAPFKGEADEVEFAGLVQFADRDEPDIALVRYEWNAADQSLRRRTERVDTAAFEVERVVDRVAGVQYRYYFGASAEGEGSAALLESATNIPEYVQVTLWIRESGDDIPLRLDRIVRIPTVEDR